ncbi:restriction endonuclease subunit S [Ottowia beijingensis]|uniref:restriction endonuclease subunit S n=1 Tax=Ottowia beijingensis TaxID=1207057 RepID=UPI002803F251|nr:restriction endonuclease subunit S [Ottowia beijingensis]
MPAHWDVVALKRLVSMRSGDAITADSIDEIGNYPVYGGNGLRGFTNAFTHDGLFALIGRQGALCGNINYAEGRFWASEHAVVVTPHVFVQVRWLGELLRAMNLGQYSVAAAQPGLAVEIIGNLRIPLPAAEEQSAIATFLDRETAKIDALVAEQEKLIALLKEKRQALISHAVTKGLDPSVPMKDSGWSGWGRCRRIGECSPSSA